MHVDVIIVGGGPAGAAAAYDLAEAGFKTLILEKTQFPRFKPCAGGVTPKALKRLRYSIAPVVQRSSATMNVGYGTKFSRTLSTASGASVIALTVRTELDQFCLQKALSQGAQFELIDKIQRIDTAENKVSLVTQKGGVFTADFLIGADGAHSRVRKLTTQFVPDRTAVAIEGVIPYARLAKSSKSLTDNKQAAFSTVDTNIPPFTFDFGVVKKGYGWLFPKGDHVNVGIYTRRPDQHPLSKNQLKQYVAAKLGTDAIDHMVGYPLGTGGEYYQPQHEQVFLVGDAAGMCEPLLGEGIHNAIKSGQAAAEAIINSKTSNDSARAHFVKSYEPVRRDVYNCRRLARFFYGGLGFSYPVMAHFPVSSLAMNGFAAGLTITECKHNLQKGKLNPLPLVDKTSTELLAQANARF